MSNSEQPSRQRARGDCIARYAGLTGAATLTSRVLRLARDHALAAFFGAGNEMDAFALRSGSCVEVFRDAAEMVQAQVRKWLGK